MQASCQSPRVGAVWGRSLSVFPFLALLLAVTGCVASEPPTSAYRSTARMAPQDPGDQEWDDEDDESPGRSFLFKEFVVSGFHSDDGMMNVPIGNMDLDHADLSPRPPGSYLGLDYVHTFADSSWINKNVLGDWLPLDAVGLHPRFLYDPMESRHDPDIVKFAPQDFWVRFQPGNVDRLTLRVGQFVIPYGVNPVLAPRQRFILPLEATDLGLKWDWGVDVKGPIGEYDWEVATTIGSGEALHSPHFLEGSERSSYLVTGRVGTPTYWDLQYGLSFLYGDLPVLRAATLLSPVSISRRRLSLDLFYKHGTYLMLGGQVTYGQDGFRSDARFVKVGGKPLGKTADVLGTRLYLDWVVPDYEDWRLACQYESVVRDTATTESDDTAVIVEITYSLTTATSVVLDYRHELNNSMGRETDALFLMFVYYGK